MIKGNILRTVLKSFKRVKLFEGLQIISFRYIHESVFTRILQVYLYIQAITYYLATVKIYYFKIEKCV